jgi:hypothetical protein
MVEFEVFILEPVSVNRFAAGSIMSCEITALNHELRNYPVKRTALVPETLLPCAERPEIIAGFRNDITVQFDFNTAKQFFIASMSRKTTSSFMFTPLLKFSIQKYTIPATLPQTAHSDGSSVAIQRARFPATSNIFQQDNEREEKTQAVFPSRSTQWLNNHRKRSSSAVHSKQP